MKIVVIADFNKEMYGKAFYNAFKKLGHNVIKIDIRDFRNSSSNMLAKFCNRFEARFQYGIGVIRYNKAIIKQVEEFKPDFVFMYRCCSVWPSTVKRISRITKVLAYNNDDPFDSLPSKHYFRYNRGMAQYCDINYLFRQKNIDDYAKIGITNTKILLPYYVTYMHFPMNLERDVEIAFMGHFEDDGRDETILKMMKAKLPIHVFNYQYWERSTHYEELKSIIRPAGTGKKYNEYLNRIQISLVFLSHFNSDTYTTRCFEIPATKSLMLAPYNDDLAAMFPENEAAVYYRNDEDLIEKCKWLLSNPDEITRIAEGGFNRLKEIGGSEIDRVQEVISDYMKLL